MENLNNYINQYDTLNEGIISDIFGQLASKAKKLFSKSNIDNIDVKKAEKLISSKPELKTSFLKIKKLEGDNFKSGNAMILLGLVHYAYNTNKEFFDLFLKKYDLNLDNLYMNYYACLNMLACENKTYNKLINDIDFNNAKDFSDVEKVLKDTYKKNGLIDHSLYAIRIYTLTSCLCKSGLVKSNTELSDIFNKI